MSSRTFAAVRPYDDWMRELVFAFLASHDYEPGPGLVVPAGTPDKEAAAWIVENDFDLLLLPYHKHRCEDGPFLDGVGVALLLPDEFAAHHVPVLMPVTDFSYQASFHRRLDELATQRPEVAKRIVVMPEAEIGSAEIAARVREISGR